MGASGIDALFYLRWCKVRLEVQWSLLLTGEVGGYLGPKLYRAELRVWQKTETRTWAPFGTYGSNHPEAHATSRVFSK